MDWLWAGVAIVASFPAALVASRLVKYRLGRLPGRGAQFAAAGASLSFSLIIVAGLLVALGLIRPASLHQLRDDTINYLPRALAAMIVAILGGVAGTILSTIVRESLGRSMGRMGQQIPTAVKGLVTGFTAILAAAQLGIDTTMISIVVGTATFGLALAFALVVGLGSRPVASEIAKGRALRRLVHPGDTIHASAVSGRIVRLHPTAVEVDTTEGRRIVPNSALTESSFEVTTPEGDPPLG